MTGGTIDNMKGRKKRIIKATLYKPGDPKNYEPYLTRKYNSSRGYYSSDVEDTKQDDRSAKTKTSQLKANAKPIGTPSVYNVSSSYKEIESKRHKLESPGKSLVSNLASRIYRSN